MSTRAKKVIYNFCLLALLIAVSVEHGLASTLDSDLEGWVAGRVQSLSLKQKLGQLLMVSIKGREFTHAMEGQIHTGSFGGVILFGPNLESVEQIKSLIGGLQNRAIMDTGVPLFIAVDQEGGDVNRLGLVTRRKSSHYSARLLGRLYEYDQVRASKIVKKVSLSMALRMRELGINMNLAPVLDLTDDENSFIYSRSFGSDPTKVITICRDLASSMKSAGVISTGKHFPNLSRSQVDSHFDLPVIEKSKTELGLNEWKPFKALRHDLDAVMMGHVLVPDIDPHHPISVSLKAGSILRRDLGFPGLIITDDLQMGAIRRRYTLVEAVMRAFYAGSDVLLGMWSEGEQLEVLHILEKAVQKGFVLEDRIDQSLRRILTLKYRYKLQAPQVN